MADDSCFGWANVWAFLAAHEELFDCHVPQLCDILASYPLNNGLDMLRYAPIRMVYKMHRHSPLPQPLGTTWWQRLSAEQRKEWEGL